jgi:hypothetical protein
LAETQDAAIAPNEAEAYREDRHHHVDGRLHEREVVEYARQAEEQHEADRERERCAFPRLRKPLQRAR